MRTEGVPLGGCHQGNAMQEDPGKLSHGDCAQSLGSELLTLAQHSRVTEQQGTPMTVGGEGVTQ